jgi:glycosyltransferase involved in cell wall biosynthesis
MNKLSVCLIVKNEEEVMERCLSAILPIADEIIVVDTGSTDNTVAICNKFPVKMYAFEWCDDFSAARNYAFEQATEAYILWIDADDILKPEEAAKLKLLKENLYADVYYLKYDYSQDEKGNSQCMLDRERIIKNNQNFLWKYPIHEVIDCNHALSKEYTDIVITHKRTHTGYAADRNRNLNILEKAIQLPQYAADARMQYYLGKEYQDSGQFEKAIRAFKTALEINTGWIEDNISAHIKIAQSYVALNSDGENMIHKKSMAAHHAKQAIKSDNRWAEPYFILGQIAFDDKLFEEAIFWFEKCLMPLPDIMSPVNKQFYTIFPLTHLMFCHDALKDHQKASLYNERALEIKPDDKGLLYNRTYFRNTADKLLDPYPEKVLNFCNGVFRKAGHINCNHTANEHIDFVIDPENMLFNDGAISGINDEYYLSYLPIVKTEKVLREWHRILAAGGKLKIREHDLAACAEQFTGSKTPAESDWYRNILYGFQNDSNSYHPQLSKISGFSKEEWAKMVTKAGFEIERMDSAAIYGTPSIELSLTKPSIQVHKIGWITGHPLPNKRFPTYRIRAYNINVALNKTGFCSELIHDLSDENIADFQALIFFRAVNEEEYNLMKHYKASGKKIVFDIAEDLFDHQQDFPFYIPMLQLADVVICCSDKLAEKIATYNNNVEVVEDAIENENSAQKQYESNGTLKAGWIGMSDNQHHAENLRPLIEACGYELIIISNAENADIKWNEESWQLDLLQCDIAIAPIDAEKQPCKSNNKITSYMALGIPVIASPLAAYKKIIRNGENGFIAENTTDWQSHLITLKDAALRKEIGKAGRQSMLRFRPENIALKLARIIVPEVYNSKAVDIIIPTIYNPGHLKICVESVIACTQSPFHITVINNGIYNEMPDKCVKMIAADNLNFSQSINLGIRNTSGPYICIMNDDIIVSDGWLEPMKRSLSDENAGFCNPLSNCEYGILHHHNMEVNGLKLLHHNNALVDLKVIEKQNPDVSISPEAIQTYVPPFERRTVLVAWVAFYCTLTTRKIIDKIGVLDEQFNNGSEDVDLCHRAKKMGLQSVVNEESFVFHFGGTSTDKYRAEPGRMGETQKVLGEKYAAPLLVIYAGFSFEPWNAETIEKEGIGGSETAAAKLAKEFSLLGYRVVLFCNCANLQGYFDGVEYKDLSGFNHFSDMHYIDVFILSRHIDIMQHKIRANKKYFWVHDVWAKGTSFGEADLVRKYQKEFNGIFCLSNWHKDFFRKTHGIDGSNVIVTQNGIDTSNFNNDAIKEKNRFIYSSSPDRSLDVVLDLFPKIKAALPDATLHIYYGFENFEKSLQHFSNQAQKALYEKIKTGIQQEGVYYHGKVGQKELADAFMKSDIWLYPTQFTETYCITALEAQMAGTLCVCTTIGALETTVGERGILITENPSDPDYHNLILEKIISIQNNPEQKQELVHKAQNWAKQQTWSAVAKSWDELFKK